MPNDNNKNRLKAPAILAAWGWRCAYCDGIADTLDHVIPHASFKETRNLTSNLIAACGDCNRKKGKRRVEEYLAKDPERLDRILRWVAIHKAGENQRSTIYIEQHPISEGKISQIRADYATGAYGRVTLARKYALSEQTIRNILKRVGPFNDTERLTSANPTAK